MAGVDVSKYEILFDLPEGEYSDTAVGGIRTKTIRAGDSLEVEAFPIVHVSNGAKREKERRGSTAAQTLLNMKNAEKKLRRLLENNFDNNDIVLHPTFDYGIAEHGLYNKEQLRKAWKEAGIPMDDGEAQRAFRNFIRRCKRLIKRRGGEPKDFKYIYVIEVKKEPRDGEIDPLPARYHYHAVISSMGILSIEDVNALWSYGYTKAEPLDFRFNGLEPLAKYITKQRRRVRKWACSKNLKKPDVKVSDRKTSRRRAAAVASDVQGCAKEIFEKIYPEYSLEKAEVRYSDFIAGAYIYARMRRKKAPIRERGR